MAVRALARVFSFVFFVASAAEGFVVTAVNAPCLCRAASLTGRGGHHLLTRTQRARSSEAPALTMSSSYEQGSSESFTGDVGGSSEMELQELVVDFTDDGRILLEVKGVKGKECRVITEELIKALGDVITTENTEEYFEEKIVNVQHDPIKLGWSYDSNKPQW